MMWEVAVWISYAIIYAKYQNESGKARGLGGRDNSLSIKRTCPGGDCQPGEYGKRGEK
jgi:hypothetical protein